MGDVLKKVPVREQAPKVRATNFDEVCLGYNKEEAMEEASRCLTCKNAKCVQGCPVSINIPAFIKEVKEGNFAEAYKVIGQSSALPAVCGRVCPQETQCEGKCIRGIKGEAVSIGKLERFVADWAKENGIKPEAPAEKNGHKVAVIGSGPSGLAAAALAAVYAELLAARKRAPVPLFLIPSVVPLIPGSTLYYTMSAAVQGNTEEVSHYGSLTLQYALSIAGGICIVWTLLSIFRRYYVLQTNKGK